MYSGLEIFILHHCNYFKQRLRPETSCDEALLGFKCRATSAIAVQKVAIPAIVKNGIAFAMTGDVSSPCAMTVLTQGEENVESNSPDARVYDCCGGCDISACDAPYCQPHPYRIFVPLCG